MNLVYYLPGYGGRLATGLGEGLRSRGWDVTGRETLGAFRAMPFTDQVHTIAQDLQQHFWRSDARVVAVSFGAYLFLHAQAQMPSYPGRVLLLSPIVGEFANEDTGTHFVPPCADLLRERIAAGRFNAPLHAEVHVGDQDWQSGPENVRQLASQLGMPCTIVPGAGHELGKGYVEGVLEAWAIQVHPSTNALSPQIDPLPPPRRVVALWGGRL